MQSYTINKGASIDVLQFLAPILLYMKVTTLQLKKNNEVSTIKSADIIVFI